MKKEDFGSLFISQDGKVNSRLFLLFGFIVGLLIDFSAFVYNLTKINHIHLIKRDMFLKRIYFPSIVMRGWISTK